VEEAAIRRAAERIARFFCALAGARPTACLWTGGSERACAMAQEGTVKFFKTDKGYGFIKPDDGQADIFVHITAVERAGLKSLSQGQRLSFEVEPDKKGKGPKAVNLTLL
jgi:cold shock protein